MTGLADIDLVTLIVGLLAGAGFQTGVREANQYVAGRRHRTLLLREALARRPDDFVAPPELTVSRGHIKQVHGRLDSFTDDFLRGLEESEVKFLLVKGRLGTGKSYLARWLASEAARRNQAGSLRKVPVFVNAGHLSSPDVFADLVQHVARVSLRDLQTADLERIANRTGLIVFVDGVDQLPYLLEGPTRLATMLERFDELCLSSRGKVCFVLVVREEFYELSPHLQALAKDVAVVSVPGFQGNLQRQSYLVFKDPASGKQRAEMLAVLLDAKPRLAGMFGKPVVLDQWLRLPLTELERFSKTGGGIANLFALSLAFPDRDLQLCQLGFFLYERDDTAFLADGELEARAGLPPGTAAELVTRTGIFCRDGVAWAFEHLSYRDYFAARAIVVAAGQKRDRVEHLLARRPLHYVVSEFVADLLDERAFTTLLSLMADSLSERVRLNVADVLTEIRDTSMRERAMACLAQLAERCQIEGDERLSAIFICCAAGALGLWEPMARVLAHYEKVGFRAFLEDFYVARWDYRYYQSSQDVAISEWIAVIQDVNFRFVRALVCRLLGDLRVRSARGPLQRLCDDVDEDERVKIEAVRALDKLAS